MHTGKAKKSIVSVLKLNLQLILIYFLNHEFSAVDQILYGEKLREMYADFFYMRENIELKPMSALDANEVNLLSIYDENNMLTTSKTFTDCEELDKMDHYGYV